MKLLNWRTNEWEQFTYMENKLKCFSEANSWGKYFKAKVIQKVQLSKICRKLSKS